MGGKGVSGMYGLMIGPDVPPVFEGSVPCAEDTTVATEFAGAGIVLAVAALVCLLGLAVPALMGGKLLGVVELGGCGGASAELAPRDPSPPPPGIGPRSKSVWLARSTPPCDRPRGLGRAGWGTSKGEISPEWNKS